MTETVKDAAEKAAARQPSRAKPDVDPVRALNAALAAAQGEFPAITRSAEVSTGSYSFKYAPLDAILGAVRPKLSKHGLAVTQLLVVDDDGRPGIRTELRHADGGMIGAFFPLLNEPGSPQQLGSLLTYLRRYALVALLGVASEDDDDGKQAADAPAVKNTPAKAPKIISADQRKRLFAIAGERSMGLEQLRDIIAGVTGDSEGSTSKIQAGQYDQIVQIVEAEHVPF